MTIKAQLNKTSDESIATTREVLKTSLASVEQLTMLNLNASKKFLEETTQALKEMMKTSSPKDLFEKVNQLATHTIESNMSSCRDVYNILAETQTKIGKMFESHIQTAQKNMVDAAENFSKLNPAAKSNFSADAVKNWIDNTTQAMNTLNKMAAGISEFANHNVKPAANTTPGTANTSVAKKVAKK